MLDRARDTLNTLININNADNDNGNGANGGSSNAKVKVKIEKADFTNFDKHKFPDGYFDRYYANLCLHYAENPDDVIREASRVLVRSGGIAGFTVWGRRDHSSVMTIVPDILEGFRKSNGNDDSSEQQKQKQKRSSFHLGENNEELRQRFLKDGLFSKCTVMHYPAVLESLDANDYVEAILDCAPSTKKELEEEYSKEDQMRIRRMVHDEALEILNRGEPLILDLVMVVAQK